jgi:NADPH:quinone reductase-like Zn-dependent oxidoreductase
MKAIVCPRYGPPEVLQLREMEKPTPKDNEVLIRVHAPTVLAGDCQLRSLNMPLSWQPIAQLGFGFSGPRHNILGQELAGEIESVGKDVRRFEGDKVFSHTSLHVGAYAEYLCLPEGGLFGKKPSSMTYGGGQAFLPADCMHCIFSKGRTFRAGRRS